MSRRIHVDELLLGSASDLGQQVRLRLRIPLEHRFDLIAFPGHLHRAGNMLEGVRHVRAVGASKGNALISCGRDANQFVILRLRHLQQSELAVQPCRGLPASEGNDHACDHRDSVLPVLDYSTDVAVDKFDPDLRRRCTRDSDAR